MSASSDKLHHHLLPMPTVLVALALSTMCVGCDDGQSTFTPFWEILHEGRSSIMLGTMHDIVDADELPAQVWEELDQATVVTTEADVRFILQEEFLEAITLPEGLTVRGAVSEAEWLSIIQAFDGIHTPEEIDRLQPWYLEGALIRALVPAVEDPIDTTLVERGYGAGVDLEFLETWEEQVTMLNALGLDEGLVILLRATGDPDGAAAAHLEWAEAYRAGDVERLTELSFDLAAMAATPQYYEEIVFRRNEAWLPMIEEQVRGGGALIAVGFMHMPTDRGLVNLLEARGYVVNLVEQ